VRAIGISTETEHSAYAVFEAGASEAMGSLCHIPRSERNPTRANARLIACAPLLLNAVRYALQNALNDREECREYYRQNPHKSSERAQFLLSELDADIALYQQAIAKATGEV
jgi:hypothetical protein